MESVNRKDGTNLPNKSGLNVKLAAFHYVSESETKVETTKKRCKKQPKIPTGALGQCFDFIEFFGKFLGWKLNYNWKSNPRHWLAISFFIFTWSQILHSQFKYFLIGEHTRILEVFALYGVAVSCTLKVLCFTRSYKRITALFTFSFKNYRQNIGKLGDKLENQQLQNLKLYQLFFLLALMSASIYVYNPIKSFVVNRDLVPLLPIEIMFTDQSKLSGFLIANALMVLMALYTVSGSAYIAFHFVAAILNYSMQVDLIEVDMNELDEFWRDTTTTTVFERRMFLRNICRKCQDKDNYIAEAKKIFDNTIYLFFCFAYISQIICLYEIKAQNWMPGYGIACGLFAEMMFYCLIGTKTSMINERLCYIITQSNWYTYDVYSQKIVLRLLHSCQNSQELCIGPLAPLSVLTGTKIVKSIYSYYTILMEVM